MRAFVVNDPNGPLPRLESTSAGGAEAYFGDICRLRKSDDSYVTLVATYHWVDVGLLEALEWEPDSFHVDHFGSNAPVTPKSGGFWITPEGMVRRFSLGWENA